MKLMVFSDIHGDWNRLQALLETDADYFFAAGDLTSWGRGLDRAGSILARKARQVFVLPGNHESHEAIRQFCEKFGLNDFHGRLIQAGGYYLAGLGYSNPTPFGTPGEYSEEELAARLEAFKGKAPLVLICHAPPRDTLLDQIRPGLHAGSKAVRQFIEQYQPEYFFCGHIHEAHGQFVQLGKTRAWNVGRAGVVVELPPVEGVHTAQG